MIRASGLRRITAVTLVGFVPGLLTADPVYTVQIYSSGSLADAQQALQAQTSAGWSAELRSDPSEGTSRHSVCLGRFTTYAEAWVVLKSLPDADYPTTAVLSWEEPMPTASENALPLELPFDTTGLDDQTTTTQTGQVSARTATGAVKSVVRSDADTIQDLYREEEIAPSGTVDAVILAKPVDQMTKEELWSVGRNAPRNTEGVPALQRFIEAHPADAKANAARLRLVRRLMARKNSAAEIESILATVKATGTERQQAIATYLSAYASMKLPVTTIDSVAAFKDVASNTAMPREMRLDAMRRAAGVAHAKRDYPTAWLAFDQLERTSTDSEVKAEARMQKAGLAFELADSEKGTWSEVRRICALVGRDPSAPKAIKATAELISAETYHKENNPEMALLKINEYLQAYPDVKREAALATLWKGIFLADLGRYSEAKSTLEPLLELELESKDLFAKVEPRAKAALWLAWIANLEGDQAKKQLYLTYLGESFPGSPELTSAQGLGLTPIEPELPTPSLN